MGDLAKWSQAQVRAAVARGVNPIDAQAAVKAFVAALPPGGDPDTYVLPDWQLSQDLTQPQYRADANGAWYGEEAGGRFAALLDAGEDA